MQKGFKTFLSNFAKRDHYEVEMDAVAVAFVDCLQTAG